MRRRQDHTRPRGAAPQAADGPRPGRLGVLLAVAASVTLLLLTAVPIREGGPETLLRPEAATLARIEALQHRLDAEGRRWRAEPTGISSLSPEAFQRLLGAVPPTTDEWTPPLDDGGHRPKDGALSVGGAFTAAGDVQALPARWDWRERDGVTAARHQGDCGGCWAFAAAGAVEGLLRIYDDRVTDLSEQQALDCNTAGYGCDGGWMTGAYRLWQTEGALSEALHPYRGEDHGTCPGPPPQPEASVLTWSAVHSTQAAIKRALLAGPVAVGMHVYADFQHYGGGVYDHDGSDEINHAVLLVGWDDVLGAWILKNSWGERWGEGGFAYVAYGSCRLGSYPHRLRIPAARPVRIHAAPLPPYLEHDDALEIEAVFASVNAPLNLSSARLMLDLGDGYRATALELLDGDTHAAVARATIGPLPAGTRVRAYLEITDESGRVARWPTQDPRQAHELHILAPIAQDDCESPGGWTLADPADDASNGRWTWAVPQATYDEWSRPVGPGADHSPSGDGCFVTGASGPDAHASDVDGGATSLISPPVDLSGYDQAVVQFWYWFANHLGPRPFEDPFTVAASADGGHTWTTLLEVRQGGTGWRFASLVLGGKVALTDQVQLRFTVRDDHHESLVVAAIDDLRWLAPAALGDPAAPAPPAGATLLALSAGPNPCAGQTELRFTLAAREHVRAQLFDGSGRLVRTLWTGPLDAGTHHVAWDGRAASGAPVASGRYWARVVAGSDRKIHSLILVR